MKKLSSIKYEYEIRTSLHRKDLQVSKYGHKLQMLPVCWHHWTV